MAAVDAQTDTKRPNRREDRGPDGRFIPGNAGGPGNPFAARVGELRAALLDAVTPDDIREVVRALVQAARGGEVAAARVLLDRVLGPPVEADILQRLESLEEALNNDGNDTG